MTESEADALLVAAARRGDPAAFDALYRRHATRVAGVCRRRVPSGDVDDVVQEAFARAFGRLETLDDGDRFGAWVRTIAVRVCADAGRTTRVGIGSSVPDVADVTVAAVDESVIEREDARRAVAGLQVLKQRDSHALWLRDALELPVSRIANDLGLTEGSTRVLLARARRRVREALGAVAAWLGALLAARRQWLTDVAGTAPATAMAALQVAVVVSVAIVPSVRDAGGAPALGQTPRADAAVTAGSPVPAVPLVSSSLREGLDAPPGAASKAVIPVQQADAPDPVVAAPTPTVDLDERPADPDEGTDMAVHTEDDHVGLELYDGGVVDHVVTETEEFLGADIGGAGSR